MSHVKKTSRQLIFRMTDVHLYLHVHMYVYTYMGAVLKPLFTFCIEPKHVRSKISAFLWSRKIRESTAKGPAKG